MIKLRILLLTVSLLVSASIAFAQTGQQANKGWNSFWTQFSAAVNHKDKVALKRLMAVEKDFFSGGGSENRNQWLQVVEKQNYWRSLQKSVRGGTKPYTETEGKPTRVTADERLVFVLIGGRWRFKGPMGD